jgi:hypothetical protein
MPIEAPVLDGRPTIEQCTFCGSSPFDPFLRGQVQRGKWDLWNLEIRPYCALICTSCKEIIGYEHPVTEEVDLKSFRAPSRWFAGRLLDRLRDALRFG